MLPLKEVAHILLKVAFSRKESNFWPENISYSNLATKIQPQNLKFIFPAYLPIMIIWRYCILTWILLLNISMSLLNYLMWVSIWVTFRTIKCQKINHQSRLGHDIYQIHIIWYLPTQYIIFIMIHIGIKYVCRWP